MNPFRTKDKELIINLDKIQSLIKDDRATVYLKGISHYYRLNEEDSTELYKQLGLITDESTEEVTEEVTETPTESTTLYCGVNDYYFDPDMNYWVWPNTDENYVINPEDTWYIIRSNGDVELTLTNLKQLRIKKVDETDTEINIIWQYTTNTRIYSNTLYVSADATNQYLRLVLNSDKYMSSGFFQIYPRFKYAE